MPATSSNLAVSPHETASSFAELGVPSALTAALTARGITTPRPIQAHTLPDGLAGRDVLGRAETGSGKTLAFGLPMLIRTAAAGGGRLARRPRGLVLVPTRELADQVHDELHPLAALLDLRLLTVYGGVSAQRQVQALRRGIDVVVATPGRLQDLVRQGACSLAAVDIAVLDEADHMADMGFLPAVTWLLDRVPPGGQRLLFSATLDSQVDTLVRRYLADPVRHVVMPTAAATARMDHQIRTVQATDKVAVAAELAARPGRTLLFVRTKHRAARLARQLDRAGLGLAPSTATWPSRPGPVPWPPSPPAPCRSWWPPTSPPAASTWMGSTGWCTSTRPPNPRPTCTGPDAPHAPEPPAPWSPWSCPSRPPRSPTCTDEPVSEHHPCRPTRRPPGLRPGRTRAAPPPAGAVAASPHPTDPPKRPTRHRRGRHRDPGFLGGLPKDRHRDYCGSYQAVQEMPPEKRSSVEAEEGPT